MNKLIKHLTEMKAFHSRKPADAYQIKEAEKQLKVKFSREYKEYLENFGEVSVYGHELTGICKASRLHVVDVTLKEREYNDVPEDFYVIEQLNIDGIVIWQTQSGEIYQTFPNCSPKKIANSILDFLEE